MPVLLTRLLSRLSARPRSLKSTVSAVLLALAFFALPATTPAATVNGVVRKLTDSTALQGAKVYWLTGAVRSDSATADSTGAYSLINIPTGNNRQIVAEMSGYAQGSTTVNLFQTTTVATANFYLGVPGSISGKVRKSTDSTAVANASVYLRRTSTATAILDSAKTDSIGNYAFTNKAPGTPNYFVTVSLTGYATTSNSNIVLNSGASVISNVYISPILPGSISGTVRRGSDSSTVAGALIYLRRTSTTNPIQDSTLSDSVGAYAFANLTAGTPNYFLTYSASSLITASNSNVLVNNGANTVSNIYLLTLGKIAIRVRKLSDSTNIAGALVLLRRGNTDTSAILDSGRTDSLGARSFANLAASAGNNYRVYVTSAGYVSTSTTGITVTNGVTTATNFYLGTPGSISGKVRKSTDSTNIAGASVYLRRTSTTNPVQDSVKTDSLGNYAFANLTPGTPNYFVTASAANFVTGSNSNIVVGTGAAVTSNVYLVPVLPGSITGAVRKATDSTAITGAKIYLRRTSTTNPIQDSTVSDGSGAYAFANLTAGTPNYFVTFAATGFAGASNSNIVVNNGANTVSNIYLTALGKITARVRKLNDSTNVSNALVLLRRGTTDTSAILDSGRTDTTGAFTFANLTASTGGGGGGATQYRVYASAAGYVSVTNTAINVTNATTTTTNFYLGTPGSISGKVRKSTDSTSIAGASVYLRRTSTTNPVQDSVLTDSVGNYAFANLTPGTPNYFVTASATNFLTASNSNLVVASGSTVSSNVYLTPVLPGNIAGNVRKATDSTNIAGAKVYLRRTSTTNPIQDSTLSDSVGHYAFAGLVAGTPNYFVTASANGYAATSNSNIAVANGASVVSNIYLTALGKITARVRKLSDSTNISNALVYLRRGTSDTTAILDSGRTDTTGAYTFANLTASTGGGGGGATQYRVYASAAGFVSATNTAITATNGVTTTTNFYLGIPGSISGTVRKATDSTALANAAVYLRRTSATSAILDSTKTDSVGHYAFASVQSGTPNYWVTASRASYVSSTNANVAVASGASVTSNFYLTLVLPGSITGTVRKLPDSALVANALVRLRRGSDTALVMDSVRTDSVGHYAFNTLVAGTPNYWVSAVSTGLNLGSNTNVAVPNGGTVTSNFLLTVPGSISGKVRGLPDSLALRNAVVQLRRGGATTAVVDSAKTDSLGNYAFNGLTLANNYRVTANLTGYVGASNANINVTSGAALTSNFTLALAARGRIYGKVGKSGDSTTIAKALLVLRRGSATATIQDSVRSDSTGRYSFANLLAGTPNYWITATATGFNPGNQDSVLVPANDSIQKDFALVGIVVVVKGSPLASQQLFTATHLGNNWVIRLPASEKMRRFEMRDVRGVMLHQAIVPAGATQIILPVTATQAGVVMRLE